jgi:dihydrofolate reductase
MPNNKQVDQPKVSVYTATSIDGYIAQEDDGLEWLERTPAPNEDFGFKEFMDSVDVLVMGRRTYEVVSRFSEWPYKEKRVVVISQSLEKVRQETELFSGNIHNLFSSLRSQGIKHIYVDGGLTISSFLEAGLVDQMIITVIPIILGKGIRLFNSMNKEHDCKLISAQSYPSGLIQLRYEVKK